MNIMSPNTLFHFTNSAENLIGILKNEFYPRYSLEKYIIGKSSITAAFSMVCFCDIPLSQIKDHIEKYGEYGIGMSKEWAKKNGLNPVLYLEKGSTLSKNIRAITINIFKDKIIRVNGIKTDIQKEIFDVLRYIKPYEGDLYGNTEITKNIRFYNEREWRYVPDPQKSEGEPFLTKKNFQNDVQRIQENTKMEEAKLSFEPHDIKYIIVKEEKEILSMADALSVIKPKYDTDTIKILMTKILTSKQIVNDF